MSTEDDVRRIALSLPDTTECLSHDTAAFRVSNKIFARIHEDEAVLISWCDDLLEKRALIFAAPDRFFTTPHYDGHASVLVHLPLIDDEELTQILLDAWRVRAPRRLLKQYDDGLLT